MISRRPSPSHTEDSIREFIVWAGAPPHSWILIPPFLKEVLPARAWVTMQLRHEGFHLPPSYVDVEVVSSGQVFMTWGWGVVLHACAPTGRHILHFALERMA